MDPRSKYSLENNQYPKTVNSATDILFHHQHDNPNKQCGSGENATRYETSNYNEDKSTKTNETSFVQSAVPNCYCCCRSGHKSPNCPEKDTCPRNKRAIICTEQNLQAKESQKDD